MGWEFNDYVLAYYDRHKGEMDLPTEYKEYLDRVMDVLREPEMKEIVERELTPELENMIISMVTEITLHQGL